MFINAKKTALRSIHKHEKAPIEKRACVGTINVADVNYYYLDRGLSITHSNNFCFAQYSLVHLLLMALLIEVLTIGNSQG